MYHQKVFLMLVSCSVAMLQAHDVMPHKLSRPTHVVPPIWPFGSYLQALLAKVDWWRNRQEYQDREMDLFQQRVVDKVSSFTRDEYRLAFIVDTGTAHAFEYPYLKNESIACRVLTETIAAAFALCERITTTSFDKNVALARASLGLVYPGLASLPGPENADEKYYIDFYTLLIYEASSTFQALALADFVPEFFDIFVKTVVPFVGAFYCNGYMLGPAERQSLAMILYDCIEDKSTYLKSALLQKLARQYGPIYTSVRENYNPRFPLDDMLHHVYLKVILADVKSGYWYHTLHLFFRQPALYYGNLVAELADLYEDATRALDANLQAYCRDQMSRAQVLQEIFENTMLTDIAHHAVDMVRDTLVDSRVDVCRSFDFALKAIVKHVWNYNEQFQRRSRQSIQAQQPQLVVPPSSPHVRSFLASDFRNSEALLAPSMADVSHQLKVDMANKLVVNLGNLRARFGPSYKFADTFNEHICFLHELLLLSPDGKLPSPIVWRDVIFFKKATNEKKS